MSATARAPDTIPIEHDTYERVIRVIVFGVPPSALVIVGWLTWGAMLRWHDLVVLVITYAITGLGVTVGYHRLFTHRSFKTDAQRARAAGRARLDGGRGTCHRRGSPRIASTTASPITPGDPHSPHVDQAPGWRGTLRGLGHAHIGWIFRGKDRANPARYAKDLLADRDLRFISRTFPLWVLAGLALPFGLGYALTGTLTGALGGLLWGGVGARARSCITRPSASTRCATASAASRFATGDESRNLAWLAPLSFGEAWHNSHHAFPTSARHGLGRWQLDPSAALISGAGALPPGLGRHPDHPRAPAGQAGRPGGMTAAAATHAGNPAAKVTRGLRDFGRRRRTPITVVASLRPPVRWCCCSPGAATSSRPPSPSAQLWVLAARGRTAGRRARRAQRGMAPSHPGGRRHDRPARPVPRRRACRCSAACSTGISAIAVRIAALRRSSPDVCPQVPTLIAAEFPILAVEGDARRADVVHARRAARPAVVAAGHRRSP